jgi:hypothetical protein
MGNYPVWDLGYEQISHQPHTRDTRFDNPPSYWKGLSLKTQIPELVLSNAAFGVSKKGLHIQDDLYGNETCQTKNYDRSTRQNRFPNLYSAGFDSIFFDPEIFSFSLLINWISKKMGSECYWHRP